LLGCTPTSQTPRLGSLLDHLVPSRELHHITLRLTRCRCPSLARKTLTGLTQRPHRPRLDTPADQMRRVNPSLHQLIERLRHLISDPGQQVGMLGKLVRKLLERLHSPLSGTNVAPEPGRRSLSGPGDLVGQPTHLLLE